MAMLVDTGANMTLLSQTSFRNLDPMTAPVLEPANLNLITATGESSPCLGQCKMQIKVGSQVFEHNVIVADINNEGILGLDFLSAHNCDLDLGNFCLTLKPSNESIECHHYASNAKVSCFKIAVTEQVEIPPCTEIIVPAKTVGTQIKSGIGIIEPTQKFIASKGLLAAKSVVDLTREVIPLRIANIHNEPCKIYPQTVAAMCEQVDMNDILANEEVVCTANKIDNGNPNPSHVPKHLVQLYNQSIENLSSCEAETVLTLLTNYSTLFSKDSNDLGRTTLTEHAIDTGYSKPIKQRPRRVPMAKMKDAADEISRMKSLGIIEPSTSPWSSNVVLVKKKDNSLRFCIDYRQLNEVTIKDSHPLPRIDDALDSLSGSKYFSTLDLKSGYWQVGLKEEDKEKTAFSFPGGGLWQFTVMAFGLCNAPATFERLMERVLSGLSFDVCLVYLDDIIVKSTTFQGHLTNLQKVFDRLEVANLKLNPTKCEFVARILWSSQSVELVKKFPARGLTVTMYQCFKDECSDLIFERKSVCERHIFEKHSGFGYKCTGCDKIFNRQENHQNRCLGAEMRLVKKSTRTFTSEEEEEYKQFLRDIPSLVKSTKQPPRTPKVRKDTRETNRKRSHSDNRENRYRGGENNKNKGFGRRGYSRGRDERRGVLEDLYDTKRQRFDERRVISETVSRRTWNDKEESNEREAREERAESKEREKECNATVERQNKEIEMERPKEGTGKNGEKDDKNLEREGEKQTEDERQIIVREQAEQEDGRTEVPQLPPEWDALSLYTEGQIDEDEVEAAVQSLTAEMDKEDQLETGATSETAIPNETRSVCSENGASGLVSPIPEYFPTDKKVLKLKKMAETQNKRIILNHLIRIELQYSVRERVKEVAALSAYYGIPCIPYGMRVNASV
ncbi:hypothetical protein FSP39_012081 [Pinctada imbricata]|uniref:Reverse transcriptase domain-containing protein n=1 Tax=Pinctada imbricata TaxID=66713 RepID=A0AA88YMF7_PINIB|nr:hypothetical protein FSP39_012081 [Pinctada imbricata]